MESANNQAGFLLITFPPLLVGKVSLPFGESVIGRSEGRDKIVINESSISKKHARLKVTKAGVWLTDLGSKNGTKINGSTIFIESGKEVAIDESMIINFADVQCHIELSKAQDKDKGPAESKKSKNPPAKRTSAEEKVDEKPVEKAKVVPSKKEKKSFLTPQPRVQEKQAHIEPKVVEQERRRSPSPQKKESPSPQKKEQPPKKKESPPKKEKAVSKKPAKTDRQSKLQVSESPIHKTRRSERSSNEVRSKEKDNKLSLPGKNGKGKSKKGTKPREEKSISRPKSKSSNPVKPHQPPAQPEKIVIKVTKPPRRMTQNPIHGIPENTEVTTTKRKSKPGRKRKMSESLESNDRKSYFENRLIPPRSQKIGKRVLVSNCTVYFQNSFFKIVKDAGDDFDYLATSKYERTVKILLAICRGIPIVTPKWVMQSEMFRKTLNPHDYVLDGIGHVYEAIEIARSGKKVFEKYSFFLASEEYHLTRDNILMLIEAAGGKVIKQSSKDEKKNNSTIALVQRKQSGSDAFNIDVKKAKKSGFSTIYSIEFLLHSCQHQKIDWSLHKP